MTTQVSKWVCYTLFRVLLPIILLAVCAVRYNALSFIYLVFLLAWPLLPTPNRINIKGINGAYLSCIIAVSALGTLAHIVFHIAMADSSAPYGSVLQNCSTAEKVARQIAVERLDGVPFLDILRLVFLDVFVLIVSVLVFVVCYKLLALQPTANEQEETSSTAMGTKTKRPAVTTVSILEDLIITILLATSGLIVLSAIGAFYVLSALYIIIRKVFYKSLGSKFSYFKIVIVIWSGLHLLLLHLYQFQFFQEAVSPELLISRILGLTGVIQTNCSQPWTIEYNDSYNWPHFVNPAIILVLYVTVATSTRQWIKRKDTDREDQYEKSWILYHILNRLIGSPNEVDFDRKQMVLYEDICSGENSPTRFFQTGSSAEGGSLMSGSDTDGMHIVNDVIVLLRDQDISNPFLDKNKTVLVMGDADSRPGYVTLTLAHLGQKVSKFVIDAIVSVGRVHFVSSELFNESYNEILSRKLQLPFNTNGPAVTINIDHHNKVIDADVVLSFQCYNWPKEADEWVSRPRLHRWPDKTLRDQIVRGGCQLVPVGDKTSDDPFLQWRISFVTAERKLIYSFSHVQFLVYGLLKYFFKQVSGKLNQVQGDTVIISSYIIKTVMFHAVESTDISFWQEKHTFLCFMFCINILIFWVRAGYCPNYFINRNNMFLGKVYGENQQKLICFLVDHRDMTWRCLSIGTLMQPTIGEIIDHVENGIKEIIQPPPTMTERKRDIAIFRRTLYPLEATVVLPALSPLLSPSESDDDEFVDGVNGAQVMCNIGMKTFGEHVAVSGNKQKYKSLRKSKNLLKPLASICASPGLLTLATYHYLTGNYVKTQKICEQLSSSDKIFICSDVNREDNKKYEDLYCGRGYTLLQKCRDGCVSYIQFSPEFCLVPLYQESIKNGNQHMIPPLPYAVFLSFLCYHELGDMEKCDAALMNLRAVKNDEAQGGGKHWIVYSLLGICYEMIGDIPRAIGEYRDSLDIQSLTQYQNPAKERIQRLQQF
ncbi:uncharacterized protein LOC132561418 [Ylistrum balloti]|uniref:uncharacterized protein LOC132561418 n=1 Tax=Ylistrum balloti TaxID=509963 RepID=UPI002905E5E1|nr:uncharacterized protein LOC132561418 [Ylistrum balloti]